MNKIIAILFVNFVLSACSTVPTASDTAPEDIRDAVVEASEIPVTTADSGLGTIVYNGNTRTQTCKRQRRTGSNLRGAGCSGPGSRSKPLKYGVLDDLDQLAMTGGVRPED